MDESYLRSQMGEASEINVIPEKPELTEFKPGHFVETSFLEEKGLNNEDIWRSIRLNNGSVQHLQELTQQEKNVFKTFKEISPMEIISQAAQRQAYIDQTQSLNLNIPSVMPIKDVNNVMIEAWKLGVKSLYSQRSQSVAKEMIMNFVNCSSCEAYHRLICLQKGLYSGLLYSLFLYY